MEVSSDWVDQSLFKSRYPGIGCGHNFFTKEAKSHFLMNIKSWVNR